MKKDLYPQIYSLAKKISEEGYDIISGLSVHENEEVKIYIVIIRTTLDKLFVVNALFKDESNLESLVKHQRAQKMKRIKDAHEIGLIDDKEKDCKHKVIAEYKSGNLGVKKLSELAGMEDVYRREYALFSDYIHISDKMISDCLEYDDNGKLVAVDMTVEVNKRNIILLTECTYALELIDGIYKKYGVQTENLKDLHLGINKLWKMTLAED